MPIENTKVNQEIEKKMRELLALIMTDIVDVMEGAGDKPDLGLLRGNILATLINMTKIMMNLTDKMIEDLEKQSLARHMKKCEAG